jgi:hypothetical protein
MPTIFQPNRVYCDHHTNCRYGAECPRALTNEVYQAAADQQHTNYPQIQKYFDTPACHASRPFDRWVVGPYEINPYGSAPLHYRSIINLLYMFDDLDVAEMTARNMQNANAINYYVHKISLYH